MEQLRNWSPRWWHHKHSGTQLYVCTWIKMSCCKDVWRYTHWSLSQSMAELLVGNYLNIELWRCTTAEGRVSVNGTFALNPWGVLCRAWCQPGMLLLSQTGCWSQMPSVRLLSWTRYHMLLYSHFTVSLSCKHPWDFLALTVLSGDVPMFGKSWKTVSLSGAVRRPMEIWSTVLSTQSETFCMDAVPSSIDSLFFDICVLVISSSAPFSDPL